MHFMCIKFSVQYQVFEGNCNENITYSKKGSATIGPRGKLLPSPILKLTLPGWQFSSRAIVTEIPARNILNSRYFILHFNFFNICLSYKVYYSLGSKQWRLKRPRCNYCLEFTINFQMTDQRINQKFLEWFRKRYWC